MKTLIQHLFQQIAAAASSILDPIVGQLKNYFYVKRLLDVIVCLLSLPTLFPLGLLIAAAIWLEDGHFPLAFQERAGFAGKRFKMFRFRTWVVNQTARKEYGRRMGGRYAPLPQLSYVGRFLRYHHLDQLPQIINVLIGDMSLIGPRPIVMKPRLYKSWPRPKLKVLPGIVGLCQVKGNERANFDALAQCDLAYAENISFKLDALILFCCLVPQADQSWLNKHMPS